MNVFTMTSTKAPKDKPYVTSRLAPRPTAASVARAARNAANRSLALTNQRQSPVRSPPSPTTSKINRSFENEQPVLDISTKQETQLCYTSPGDLYNTLNESKEQMAFSSSAGDTQNSQEIANFDSNNLDNMPEYESEVKSELTKLPQTPTVSRPQTPKFISSRPQTPRPLSRPSTPAHPLQRHSTPISRPNTPQRNHTSNTSNLSNTPLTRPKTPSTPISPKPVMSVPSHDAPQSTKNNEDLKSLYLNKQKEFHHLKRELDLQQQEILKLFDGIRNLREHMMREGISVCNEEIQELLVLNVADWAPEEVTQLCRDAVSFSNTDGAVELFNKTVPLDECTLAEMESKALKVPVQFAELCLQAFTARQDLINWVKDLIEKNEIVATDAVERIANYNTQGLELYEVLRDLKTRADDAVDTIIALSRRACEERSTLIAVGESLVREVARLRQDLETRPTMTNEICKIQADADISKELEQTRQLLEEERVAKSAMKDKLTSTETQLRQTRLRVSKMDRQLREAEASIASLTGTVKTLEDQSRQREVQLEARARKLKESLKTGEVTSSQLAQQRDSLKNEVKNLKEQIQTLTDKHKSEEQTMNNKLNDLMSALDEEKKLTQAEIEQKHQLEVAIKENQNTIEKLKAKCTGLEGNRLNPDLPTEREMDMWAELQATKDTLRLTEEEMNACKREKVRFLETLTKIAESDDKVGIQQKLAAELLTKEEILGKNQLQIRELTKMNKLNEQKIIQYEEYFRELQIHNSTEENSEDAINNSSYQYLQQEIMNLKMSLLDALHSKEELAESLAEKEQQLEHQNKTSRAQAKVIKVREELINMLNNKETEQSRKLATLQQDLEHRMKIVDEVNKQIGAKADEIQELFTTLENKQQQIHRLEKIVFALEEQQTRSQAQRTRQEEKIAALEHELAAGNRRERKFLFF
ncbi:unnamed protein product, partial [Brenthis ino]